MRIAVLLSLSEKTSGGSFQFNKTIYETLIKERQDFQHELFFVFEQHNQIGIEPDLALPSKFQHRLYFLRQYARELLVSLFTRKKFALINCRSAWLNRKLLANNIEAVWAVNPLSIPLDLPYITTSWDISHKITPFFKEISESGLQLIKRDKICESVFSKAYRIVVGTEHGKNEISNSYGIPLERLLVQPLPVKRINRENNVLRDRYQFIYPANFWPHKNHVIIIHALRKLIFAESIPIKFIFTGVDKGNFAYIKNLVDIYALGNYIEFKGYVSEDMLLQLYKTSNACVFPSLIGPDNLPPLEALASGSNAIVADISGAKEQFGDFATYFDPYDATNLSQVVQQAISNFRENEVESNDLIHYLESRTSEIYVNSIVNEFVRLEMIIRLSR
jgi:glycosyltransferase involved in cell wall biosynthesis